MLQSVYQVIVSVLVGLRLVFSSVCTRRLRYNVYVSRALGNMMRARK